MLIKNAKIITWGLENQILEDCSLWIESGKIKQILSDSQLKDSPMDEETIDAHGQYVMPGNICAHTHFYGAFSRGMSLNGNPPQNFPEILQRLWWPLDKSLDPKSVYLSALVCIIDAIQHGTTTLFDHHASQHSIPGSLDLVAQAVLESGVRADLCYEVTDRDGERAALEGIAENLRFIQTARTNKESQGLIAAHFGLHASLTLSEKTLEMCRQSVTDETGFHIHAAEHTVDEYDSIDKSGHRVIDRLNKHGILGKNTIVAHGVHIDSHEVELIKQSGTWLSHQPRSNMNNAVGISDVESWLRLGVKICLGNDGFSNSMWDEWKTCYLEHKSWNRDPRRMGADKIVQMAIQNNGLLASSSFGGLKIGTIEPGATADIIFVDYKPFTELIPGNLPWHIIFGFRESMITSTMVNGKFLMLDRKFTTLDVEKIIADARQSSKEVWQRYRQMN
jgi:putative selenium metabolism protein SsnA